MTEEYKEKQLKFEIEINAQPLWCVGIHIDSTGANHPVDVINTALAHYFADYGYEEDDLNIAVKEIKEASNDDY